MSWKAQLERYEQEKKWSAAMALVQQTIRENPDNAEAYVRAIYLLHYISIGPESSEVLYEEAAALLKHYFDESREKFADDAEYLFFTGKMLYIAEWLFGLDDDDKPIEKRLAFQMQKKAAEKEPDNLLFEWACCFSLNYKSAGYLASQILLHHTDSIAWLQSKGFAGRYMLSALEGSKNKYLANAKSCCL